MNTEQLNQLRFEISMTTSIYQAIGHYACQKETINFLKFFNSEKLIKGKEVEEFTATIEQLITTIENTKCGYVSCRNCPLNLMAKALREEIKPY